MAGGRKGRRKNKPRSIWPRVLYFLFLFALIIGLAWWITRPEKEPDRKASRRPAVRESPQLALIIDDGGYNVEVVREILAFGRPITFAILPHSPHARGIAALIHKHGGEVMLHLPMEPKEGNFAPVETHTVMVGMSRDRIQRILREAFREVPHARGVNNHMGSKATEDPEVMRAVMDFLRKEGVYFIDSYTSPESVGEQMARKAGVPFERNHQFLDPGRNLASIQEAIRLAIGKAKKEGKAVAIGHPLPLTVQAIRKMIPEIEREGVRLVFASEVVQ